VTYAGDPYARAPYAGTSDSSAVTLTLGRATSTSSARSLTAQVGTTATLNRASTTATARPITLVAGNLVDLNRAVSTASARALTAIIGTTATLGRATSTATARTITPGAGSLGRATSTSSARPLTVKISITLNRATTTATARPFAQLSRTQTNNRAGGRVRSGLGEATYEPPIVAAPEFDLAPVIREATHAFTTVTMDGTMPVYTATIVDRARDRDRILVGGKDVTFFRGVATPTPDYALISPLLYGSGSLTLPQVNPLFEHLGTGALKWLRKGKPVVVQRVNAAGNIVATDYRGIIVAFNVSGNALTVELGGQASGRAALRNKQIPIFRGRHDAGFWGIRAVAELRVPTAPLNGPDTGIVLHNAGGMSQLDYINQVCSMAVTGAGEQYTIMPVNGVYRMMLKDIDTIDVTAYFDDARIKPDLRRDIAEEPNRVFATGVRHDGQRVRFGAYPGLKQGEAPDYPMNDNSAFGQGTVDADTDTGDGVTVMLWKLQQAGYLDERDAPGGYDDDVTDAIKVLQDDRGTTQTGNMNPTTWRALFDLDVTGYSTMWSRILPAAQLASVREWDRTGNGSLSSRNPNYDPHVIPVDRNIDAGAAFTRQRIRKFARTELSQGDNWVGTVDLNFGLISGEHNPGDALTSSDVKQARGVRPGMNLWAPLFDGGTLFHVSGVQVSNGGKDVQLTVDTRARDTMKVWQVIQRNRESRQNPARAWINQYRSSTISKDGLGEWDEIGGLLDSRVSLNGGTWNVFPVVAGQEGTVSRLRFQLTNPDEFAMTISGRKISAKRLNHLVPRPLAYTRNDHGTVEVGDDTELEPWYERAHVRDVLRDKFLLYAAGTHDEPCGYAPARKTRDDGDPTGEPATGLHVDDAGFSYRTFSEPVLWVAIWVSGANAVQAGRVMWNQLEVGS
jgi:hypothetical protein